MRFGLLLLVAVSLVACSKPARYQGYADEKTDAQLIKPPPPAAADAAAAASAQGAPAPTKPPAPGSPANAVGVPQLAYDYKYGIEASAPRIRLLIEQHTSACVAAGPMICQMIASNVDAAAKEQLHATLQLRATPAWLSAFRARLKSDAAKDGGRLSQEQVTSEDLSRQIVDTEATTRAKTELRDRLLAVLKSRPAKTSDLVEAEKALAEVQEELDAANSELGMMRQRVATSGLTVDYQTLDAPGAPTTWAPLRSALHGFIATVVLALSTMITAIGWLAPWVLAIGLAVWLFGRYRRRRSTTPKRKPTSAPD